MEINIAILLRLLFAHILSDFVLQTDRLNKGKKGEKKYHYLSLHSFIHATLAYVCAAQWNCWMIPLVIFTTHFVIDYIKAVYMKENVLTLIVDQLLHVSVLFILWVSLFGEYSQVTDWIENECASPRVWMILMAYLVILKPTSIFVNQFITRWTPPELSSQSLPNAGQWIGYLERILIITFMLAGYMEGVGFLLAAKSIFRFGELTKANEIKITEYVLIGTLASFSIAILTGLLLQHLI